METPGVDLPFEDELLSERDLAVGLPPGNATFLSLAQSEADRIHHPPITSSSMARTRKAIAEAIVLRRNRVRAEHVASSTAAEQIRLKLGSDWTVPVTRIAGRGRPALVFADGGRMRAGPQVNTLLAAGRPVIVADIYGTGESVSPANLHMTLSVTGERPLGVMVGQIMDVVAWAGGRGVDVYASGVCSSFATLCAAALDPTRFSSLHVNGLVDSLRRLIDTPYSYLDAVPLFCFGLLRVVDVPQLIDLCEGLPIAWLNRGPVYSRPGHHAD